MRANFLFCHANEFVEKGVYSHPGIAHKTDPFGAVAQLIERVVRNDEVAGLIPVCSTILRQRQAFDLWGQVTSDL